jgi:ribosomal protein S2
MISKKKKKINNNNILVNSLFKAKSIYGESLAISNKNVIPFIYGVRHNYAIINLKDVSFFLKRVFKLIQSILNNKEKILVIGNSEDIKSFLYKSFQKKNNNIIFFDTDWVNGLITNKIVNKLENKEINLLIKKEEIKLILIIKSSTEDKFLNKELSSLQIPVIAFINTSQDPSNINYPIVTNTKNVKSLYTLMYLFRKIF